MAFGGEDAESYYDEGVTASMRGDIERAIECFNKTLELDKDFISAYHQLAKCEMRKGRFEQAIALLERVIRAKPKQIPPRLDLGHALLQTGRTKEARRIFQEVSNVEPANSRALLGLAETAFQEGSWKEAMELAGQSQAISGPNFTALYLRGRAARLAGDLVTAQQCLDDADKLLGQSIELTPDQPEGYFLRGEVHFAKEHYAAALDHFRSSYERASEGRVYTAYGMPFRKLDLLIKQGLCLQRLDRRAQAREIGELVLEKDPDNKLGKALKELD